jgi:uncharacterized membrane protein YtjA (UPF0391 family)
MLKRAGIALLIAAISALFGFTGWFGSSEKITQLVCFISLGVCLLSLLFSLFEPSEAPASAPRRIRRYS